MIVHRTVLARRLAQVLDFSQDRGTVGGEKLFRDAHKADDAAVRGNTETVRHEVLNHGGVALVGRRLDLGRKGGDGQDVGGVKGTGVKEAGRVVESNEDGGNRAVVALREVLGKIGKEDVFVFYL